MPARLRTGNVRVYTQVSREALKKLKLIAIRRCVPLHVVVQQAVDREIALYDESFFRTVRLHTCERGDGDKRDASSRGDNDGEA